MPRIEVLLIGLLRSECKKKNYGIQMVHIVITFHEFVLKKPLLANKIHIVV